MRIIFSSVGKLIYRVRITVVEFLVYLIRCENIVIRSIISNRGATFPIRKQGRGMVCIFQKLDVVHVFHKELVLVRVAHLCPVHVLAHIICSRYDLC